MLDVGIRGTLVVDRGASGPNRDLGSNMLTPLGPGGGKRLR